MTRSTRLGFALTLSLVLILSACNLPSAGTGAESPVAPEALAQTAVAATMSAIQAETAAAPTATVPPQEPTATPTVAFTFTPFPTPQNPLVVKDALCWMGPGPVYEVVSSVKTGIRVELLGRGSVGAWWIIKNPRYNDPCWLQADVLQFDAGYDLTNLKVFTPPPTPTPVPTDTPTPTNTPHP